MTGGHVQPKSRKDFITMRSGSFLVTAALLLMSGAALADAPADKPTPTQDSTLSAPDSDTLCKSECGISEILAQTYPGEGGPSPEPSPGPRPDTRPCHPPSCPAPKPSPDPRSFPGTLNDFARQRHTAGINGGAFVPLPPVMSFPIILPPGDTPINGGSGGPPGNGGGGWAPQPSEPPRGGDIPA
jgi:hypothetical protein